MVDVSVDFEFYQNQYKGNAIPSSAFDKYIELAHFDLLNVIGMNMYDIQDDEKELIRNIQLCKCALAEFEFKYGLYRDESQETKTSLGVGEVKSESAGSVSRSYVTSVEANSQRDSQITKNTEKYKMNIIYRYLKYSGLIYRGLK